jgi:hypothetical protein
VHLSSQRDNLWSTHLSRKARFYKDFRRYEMLSNTMEITSCATGVQQKYKRFYGTFFSEAIRWKVSSFYLQIRRISSLSNLLRSYLLGLRSLYSMTSCKQIHPYISLTHSLIFHVSYILDTLPYFQLI